MPLSVVELYSLFRIEKYKWYILVVVFVKDNNLMQYKWYILVVVFLKDNNMMYCIFVWQKTTGLNTTN